MNKNKKSIISFIALTGILSAIVYYFIIFHDKYLTALLMWCPGIAAIIIKNIYYRREKVFSFKSKGYKYIILGVFIPVIYLGISYIIFWLIRPASFTIDLGKISIINLLITAVFSIVTAAGEEIGWRGFLVPRLIKEVSFAKTAIFSGIIWALWHFPLIISGNYIKGAPLTYILIAFTIEITAMAVIMAYLTIKGQSMWPAILLHASHNYFDQIIFDELTTGKLKVYMVSETGMITCAIAVIIAIICYRKAIKN